MAESLELRFALTRAEYAAAARAGSDRFIRVGAVTGAAILALGVGAQLSAVTVVGVMVVVAALVAWTVPWWRWFGEPSLQDEEHWVIDDHGCTIERSGSRSHNRWTYYREVIDVGRVYALLTSRAGVDVVPKRALATAADADTFVALVGANIAVRETPAPPSGWTD